MTLQKDYVLLCFVSGSYIWHYGKNVHVRIQSANQNYLNLQEAKTKSVSGVVHFSSPIHFPGLREAMLPGQENILHREKSETEISPPPGRPSYLPGWSRDSSSGLPQLPVFFCLCSEYIVWSVPMSTSVHIP